ncbi:CgeB family protein [Polaromonas sp.]|uniref:CgeB family protein n=1 Tax=Polaromonas sp. TaxID=1869339 RepID=UPI002FC8880B
MKILLVCMEYDYGDPSRGHSYEYYNFYQSLKDLGHEVTLFDYMAELKRCGKTEMNSKLLDLVQASRPDLAMFSLYTDQLDPATVKQMGSYTRTLCFFHDDTWRVEFSQFWARQFDFFTTPDVYGERKYTAIGLPNAIHFPFGCNEKLYRKTGGPKKYDVSFVGAWHPYREWLIKRLRKAGFTVEAVGYRWPGGIVSHEQMVALFNESRINLNMSNSASWDARYLLSSPRGLVNRIRSPKSVEQLKARHFEINGSGGFQLSYYVEGLERHYEIGREVAVYLDPDDLLKKVALYLADEPLRETIAEAGYARTMVGHTFGNRFRHVFNRMGLLHV